MIITITTKQETAESIIVFPFLISTSLCLTGDCFNSSKGVKVAEDRETERQEDMNGGMKAGEGRNRGGQGCARLLVCLPCTILLTGR